MTLRDCSLFIRMDDKGVPKHPVWGPSILAEKQVEDGRLADLDLKAESKMEGWRELERALIDEGWYAGRANPDDSNLSQPCLLSR